MGLSEESRAELESRLYSGVYDGTVAWRAQIVLWFDQGKSKPEIERLARVTRSTINKWLKRYADGGLEALSDIPSPGRPRTVTEVERSRILALSRTSPPKSTGLTHWSTNEMAKYLRRHEGIDVSHNFVAVLWREHGLAPHRQGTFKLSRDPLFATKVMDVVGLYLNPPEGAVVLSVDEKTQIQALDRTQPLLPMTFDKTEKRTHDYVRHGTTNLFAALDVQTGNVTGICYDRRRTVEFIDFMTRTISAHPGKEIHVVVDNLSTHSGKDIEEWLQGHPKVTFGYTPTGSSWLNQIENWFSIITKQSLSHATMSSVIQLKNHIDNYITTWNENPRPFTWTATAEDIIRKVQILQTDFNKLLDINRNA